MTLEGKNGPDSKLHRLMNALPTTSLFHEAIMGILGIAERRIGMGFQGKLDFSENAYAALHHIVRTINVSEGDFQEIRQNIIELDIDKFDNIFQYFDFLFYHIITLYLVREIFELISEPDNTIDARSADHELLFQQIRNLREDFAKHVMRLQSTPSEKHMDWPGKRAAGMKASEWVKLHYRDEIDNGTFRLEDIRTVPGRPDQQSPLYTALRDEARRADPPFSTSDIAPHTSRVYQERREAIATLLGVDAGSDEFTSYINSLVKNHPR